MVGYKVVTWHWGDKYTTEQVNILYRMVMRNVNGDVKFYCVTDDMERPYDEGITLIDKPGYNFPHRGTLNSYIRLWNFSKDFEKAVGGGMVLQLDIDTVITADITHLFDSENGFRVYKCTSTSKLGYALNPSVLLWDSAKFHFIWESFIADSHGMIAAATKAGYRGTDQEIVSFLCDTPETELFGKETGIYSMRDDMAAPYTLPKNTCMVCFYGNYDPINYKALKWVNKHYR